MKVQFFFLALFNLMFWILEPKFEVMGLGIQIGSHLYFYFFETNSKNSFLKMLGIGTWGSS
jgi:hypothetical protein